MNHNEFLIVDDEPDICWALEHLLTANGLPCQTALTAQAALDLMTNQRFHLAFVDVTLPDMNGIELARRLRQMDPFIRLVFVSGYLAANAAAVAQIQEEGLLYACITKPFLHQEILGAIESFAAAEA